MATTLAGAEAYARAIAFGDLGEVRCLQLLEAEWSKAKASLFPPGG